MECLECKTENMQYETNCRQCGVSLHPSLALLYLDRAEEEIGRGQYEAAGLNMIKADQEMLASSKEQREKHQLSARAFWLQGCIYYQKGKMEEARTELLLARRVLEGIADGEELLADIENRLGNIYYYEGELGLAAEHYRQSSEVAIIAKAYPSAVKAITNLGNISVLRGEMNEAVAHYNRALEYAQGGDALMLATSYRILAWLHGNYGPLPLALDYANKALGLREQFDNLETRSLVVNDAAAVYIKMGMFEEAEQYLREVYELAQQTGSKLIEERLIPNLAELLRYRGDSDSWFARAVKTFNDSSSPNLFRSDFALQVAIHYIAQEDWVRIHRHVQQLANVAERETNSQSTAILDHAQALLHTALGEWDEAANHFEGALATPGLPVYNLATLWQDYAAMLLRRAGEEDNESYQIEAQTALERAAALFRQLQLDYRLNLVEDMLKGIPVPVYEKGSSGSSVNEVR